MDLLVATNNDHKRRELAAILHEHRLLVPADLGIKFDFAETGDTFLANAMGKAEALRRQVATHGLALLADDSGLCVDGLGGRPGILSARYGSPDERNALLLSELEGVTERGAHFVCCMVVLIGKDRFFVAQERWDGRIAMAPSSGAGGFGYDPVFYLPELGCTAADLPESQKNRLSHRGKAAMRLAELLQHSAGEDP